MPGQPAVFDRLAQMLPPSVHASHSMEEQARATLRYLSDKFSGVQAVDAVPEDPQSCPNCDTLTLAKRTPYCSPQCQEISAFVRQFRSGLRDESLLNDDRLVAFGQTLWYFLGGGRPLRQSMVPAKDVAKVLARENGKCQVCGGVATTIDHDKTGCNRTINLRAVCENCSKTKPFGDPRVLNGSLFESTLQELAQRIANPVAVRCCDDAETWNWRAYLKRRTV